VDQSGLQGGNMCTVFSNSNSQTCNHVYIPSQTSNFQFCASLQKTEKNADTATMSSSEPVAERFSFPTEISQFDDDDRISFSRLESKYIAVGDDGTEYEFNPSMRRWIPQVDEDLIAAQQAAYGRAREGDGDVSRPPAQQQRGKKRKQDGTEVCRGLGVPKGLPP
jgi:hypothetical protein